MAHSGAAAGGELEEKVDLSAEVDAKLEQAKTLAGSNQLKEAIVLVTALEKRCRVGNDTPSLVKVCEAALQYCKDAVRAMVNLAMPWVVDSNAPVVNGDFSEENRNALVVALRDITDGKLFLEAERARLTRALAAIKEQAGDIAGAATALQEEKNAIELAKDFHSIYSTPIILADDAKWQDALQTAVLFLALAPYSNEQQDLMQRIKADHNLERLAASHATIALLLQNEIISYPLQHQAELESLAVFQKNDLAEFWKETFQRRIVQHNIRVISKYYKRIHGRRLAQLLGLTRDQLEREVSNMVSAGDLYAKMDRPADIIRFAQNQTPESILSEWASDIDKLLGLVQKTTHLIQKENMTQ
ncbi:COP9 signalosome complex subunit 7 [Fragilaria crotonensis]|nr:COP9 signalosome complex subunit 7 [Fragilaria crotonensis]